MLEVYVQILYCYYLVEDSIFKIFLDLWLNFTFRFRCLLFNLFNFILILHTPMEISTVNLNRVHIVFFELYILNAFESYIYLLDNGLVDFIAKQEFLDTLHRYCEFYCKSDKYGKPEKWLLKFDTNKVTLIMLRMVVTVKATLKSKVLPIAI